jgi:uncharacterized protein (DUF885 family)
VIKRIAVSIVLLIVLASGLFVYSAWWGKPWSIDHAFDIAFAKILLQDPELLSMLGIVDNTPLDFHSDKLTDISPEADLARLAWARQQSEILESYDLAAKSEQQQLSAQIFSWFLDDILRGEEFLFHEYPVKQLDGWPGQLPSLFASYHQVVDEQSARNYLSRLAAVPLKVEQGIQGLSLRAERGIMPPRFVFQRVLHDLESLVAIPAESSLFYTSLENSLAGIDGIDGEQRQAMKHQALALVDEAVYPAYRKLIAYWRSLSRLTTDEDGVWKLPNGDAYYAHILRHHTTTNLSPEEVHQLGLLEVDRIGGEISRILTSLDVSEATVGAALAKIAENPSLTYAPGKDGREAALSDAEAAIAEAAAAMPAAFSRLPVADVEIRRVPEFEEQSRAAASYFPPAMDGSRPGIFWLNLRAPEDDFTTIDLRTTVFHEAIPGHHFQLALAQEIEDVPAFRRMGIFNAYTEGWALYAEQLAWEYGLQDDPYDNIGRLQAEMWRAVRLVVDTGIHYKRWTRQQAMDYMLANTGLPESTIETEIERYIVLPGQACSYKLGMMKILELRRRSQNALGESFDIRRFHEVILMNGAMPLDILEQVVQAYIDEALTQGQGANL